MQTQEQLGDVVIPSGLVMIVDMGLLNFWSHDQEPVLTEGILPTDELTEIANNSEDFRIDGPDAEKSGRTLELQWNPLYLYDIPAHAIANVRNSFENLKTENGWQATLSSVKPRIAHRDRVDHAIQFGKGAGEVQFHGMSAVAVNILPQERPLSVVGFRMEGDEYAKSWREVHLLVRPDSRPARTNMVGVVAVDKARLMFVDADVLGLWQHEEPIDGMADFVFWGRDAQIAADKLRAEQLGDCQYGWKDVPVMDAVELGTAVEEFRDEADLKFATDFRPHSHHYYAMELVRNSSTESGVVELGDTRACAFMTTWGDGFFPVFNDLDEQGRTVRLRIELGNERSLANMRYVNQ